MVFLKIFFTKVLQHTINFFEKDQEMEIQRQEINVKAQTYLAYFSWYTKLHAIFGTEKFFQWVLIFISLNILIKIFIHFKKQFIV